MDTPLESHYARPREAGSVNLHLRVVVTVVALSLGMAVGVIGWGGTASPAAARASKTYVIHLHAVRLGPSRVRVRGETNLPTGAVIQLSGSRAFRNAGERDVRAVNAGDRKVKVSNGHFAAVLPLDEKTLMLGVGKSKYDDRIAVIDNAVTACAEFQTGRENLTGKPYQPDPRVRKIVGARGERLKGSPQVTVFGSATPTPANWLETTVRVATSSPLFSDIAVAQGTVPKEARLAGFCLS
jgi:hypothetical protein